MVLVYSESQLQELLSQNGLAASRKQLATAYPWFFHKSSLENYPSIQNHGLLPKPPRGANPPQIVCESLGGPPPKTDMVCLNPIGTLQVTIPNSFVLTLRGSDLPKRVGADWSYSDLLRTALSKRAVCPSLTVVQAFVKATEDGSVASYDPIARELLRVRTKACVKDDPASWPFLATVAIADLEIVDV